MKRQVIAKICEGSGLSFVNDKCPVCGAPSSSLGVDSTSLVPRHKAKHNWYQDIADLFPAAKDVEKVAQAKNLNQPTGWVNPKTATVDWEAKKLVYIGANRFIEADSDYTQQESNTQSVTPSLDINTIAQGDPGPQDDAPAIAQQAQDYSMELTSTNRSKRATSNWFRSLDGIYEIWNANCRYLKESGGYLVGTIIHDLDLDYWTWEISFISITAESFESKEDNALLSSGECQDRSDGEQKVENWINRNPSPVLSSKSVPQISRQTNRIKLRQTNSANKVPISPKRKSNARLTIHANDWISKGNGDHAPKLQNDNAYGDDAFGDGQPNPEDIITSQKRRPSRTSAQFYRGVVEPKPNKQGAPGVLSWFSDPDGSGVELASVSIPGKEGEDDAGYDFQATGTSYEIHYWQDSFWQDNSLPPTPIAKGSAHSMFDAKDQCEQWWREEVNNLAIALGRIHSIRHRADDTSNALQAPTSPSPIEGYEQVPGQDRDDKLTGRKKTNKTARLIKTGTNWTLDGAPIHQGFYVEGLEGTDPDDLDVRGEDAVMDAEEWPRW